MTVARSRNGMAIVLVTWLAAAPAVSGQETLARAKDLYILASYDEALVLLNRLRPNASANEATEIAGYQVYCLLALGRTDDAQRAIEALVKTDPFFRPSETTASPRTRAIFDDVRRSLLPGIVQESYDRAKAAYDRNDAQVAVTEFDRLLSLLDEPGLSNHPAMADLRRLALGFRDLSKAATTAATAPAAATTLKTPVPTLPAPTSASPESPAVYSASDTNVVAPVVVSRPMPPWHPRNQIDARRLFRGVIELTIDERGDVVSALLGKSVHTTYDSALLDMARTWKFRPATREGVPVRYRATMEVRLDPVK
jgi:TonB family protein